MYLREKEKPRVKLSLNDRGSFLFWTAYTCFIAVNHFILNKIRWRPLPARPEASNPLADLSSMSDIALNTDSAVTALFD